MPNVKVEKPTTPKGGGPAKAPSLKDGTCDKFNADTDLKSTTTGAFYCYDPLLLNYVDGPKVNLCLDPSCQHNKKGSLTYIWGTCNA